MDKITSTHGFHVDYDNVQKPELYLVSSYARKVKSPQQISEKITHPFWVLDYTVTDSGRIRIGGRKSPWIDRKANIAHLYPPHTSYWEDSTRIKSDIASTFIIFEGGRSIGLDKLINKKDGFAKFADPDGILLDKLLKIADLDRKWPEHKILTSQGELYLTINLLFNAKLIAEGDYLIKEKSGEDTENLSLSSKIRFYLQKHFREKITIQELASKFNVSASTLSHKYKQETGEGPIATLVSIRINFAKGMILKGIPLKEVAEASGFNDEFYLSKMFKQLIGISPKQYQKLLQKH